MLPTEPNHPTETAPAAARGTASPLSGPSGLSGRAPDLSALHRSLEPLPARERLALLCSLGERQHDRQLAPYLLRADAETLTETA